MFFLVFLCFYVSYGFLKTIFKLILFFCFMCFDFIYLFVFFVCFVCFGTDVCCFMFGFVNKLNQMIFWLFNKM